VVNERIERAQRTDDQTSDDEAGDEHELDTSLDNLISPFLTEKKNRMCWFSREEKLRFTCGFSLAHAMLQSIEKLTKPPDAENIDQNDRDL
jgi:hypothetical protein